jgi:hypothetical protein
MKLARYFGGLLCGISFAVLAGCGVPGVPKPPSLKLPQPVADLRAARKGDKVFLAWTVPTHTTDRGSLRHPGATRICRSPNPGIHDCPNPNEQAAVLLPLVPSRQNKAVSSAARIEATYTDNLPHTLLGEDPAAQIFYAVSLLNEHGRSAGLSNIVSVPAAVALAPPSDFAVQVTAEGVILSWTGIPHPREIEGIRRVYRVYRRDSSGADMVAGELPLGTLLSYVLVDHSFEWEKTYFYRATVLTLIHAEGKPETQFEGDDTPAVQVFAHDIFPPAIPSGLQAVFSGVGQAPFVDLIWASDTDADLAGYNIFRHEAGGEPVKINSELVKAPAFRDANVSSGHTYVYSVSAVDVRGNESARSEEASEAVP